MCNSHEHRQTAGFIPSAQGLILGEIPDAQILLEPSAKSGAPRSAPGRPGSRRSPGLRGDSARRRGPARRAHAGELLPAQRRARLYLTEGRR